MDQKTQIRNYYATLENCKQFKPRVLEQDKKTAEHAAALQAMASEAPVRYSETLRKVKCEGSRAPPMAPQVLRKPPGYIRNQLGGFFTS